MKSIICRANDFATAVVCGIERSRSALSEARIILSSGSTGDLYQFADELHQDLTKIHGSLLRTQQRMGPTNHGWRTVRNLVGLFSRTNRGFNVIVVAPPNQAIPEKLATNMSGVVQTCNRLIEMISQLKKEAVYVEIPGSNDKTMAALKTVIRDLESRDRECRPLAYKLLEKRLPAVYSNCRTSSGGTSLPGKINWNWADYELRYKYLVPISEWKLQCKGVTNMIQDVYGD
ncbi:hypothetical protein SCLCIDRAFT_10782 [Scleroderma citrinum Foug A]|uniref:Uncharacterized protein n=1 Tax=Scleroderma citrinum Foug A TaxID=1036808 RepID=A0A0C2ZUP4_9AGAM|nr:hypothetical protein SCLCIDRAFT_10782 [Scleroderma citrinum Foug A]